MYPTYTKLLSMDSLWCNSNFICHDIKVCSVKIGLYVYNAVA